MTARHQPRTDPRHTDQRHADPRRGDVRRTDPRHADRRRADPRGGDVRRGVVRRGDVRPTDQRYANPRGGDVRCDHTRRCGEVVHRLAAARAAAARLAAARLAAACLAAACLAAACLAATPATAAAQSQVDLLFHGSALSYTGTLLKEGGHTAGAYGAYGTGWKHLAELGGTLTRIRYTDGTRLEQTDLTAAYSRFWARGSARLGAHLVDTTDPATDGGIVGFGGLGTYRPGVWSAGAEAALSRYGSYGDGLTVLQLAPAAGIGAGDARRGGRIDVAGRGYFIRLSGDAGLDAREFLSAEAAVYLTLRTLTLSGTAWAGEQAFAVRTGGFLVFNIAELHTGGYGGGARWVMTPRSALSAGLYVERFTDLELTAAQARSIAVSLGFTI
jgi:hypothetical protein